MEDHGIGMTEALLGLDGFRVLEVAEGDGELIVRVESIAEVMVCGGCGRRAESQDRVERAFRDLPCFGRPVRLVWRKRRWRCRQVECPSETWTETSEHVSARTVLTLRAGSVDVPPGGGQRPTGRPAGSRVRGGCGGPQ
jgi:transposase